MTKPDWKDAPEWAQWRAKDSDGSWYWYKIEPHKVGFVWSGRGKRIFAIRDRDNYANWRESLEQRPEVQP